MFSMIRNSKDKTLPIPWTKNITFTNRFDPKETELQKNSLATSNSPESDLQFIFFYTAYVIE